MKNSLTSHYARLKRTFARTIGALTVLTLCTSSAFAFSDVSRSSYYSDAVEFLLDMSVVDDRPMFYPAVPLKRSELAKMTLLALDTESDTLSYRPFTDVRASDWFAPYVETGYELGFFSGYMNADGYYTGRFGPADYVTRAQALKTLILAFGLEPEVCDKTYPSWDTNYSQWYGEYVDTACAHGILTGSSARPNEIINRADFVTMLYRVMKLDGLPTWGGGGPGTTPTTPTTPTVPNTPPTSNSGDSTLFVKLSPSSPVPTVIPADAAGVKYTTFTLTAEGDDVEVTAIDIYRQGLGSHGNFSEVWLSVDGFMLGSARNINSDGFATMNLNSDKIIVPEGESIELEVMASMSSNVGSNLQNKLGIKSEDDISTNADEVVGAFPLYGYSMTTSSYTLGSLYISADGNDNHVNVGDVKRTIGEFEVENASAGSEHFILSTMDFEINGSSNYESIMNAAIYYMGERVTETVTPFDDHLRFQFLDDGFMIEDGQTEDFQIKADIVGGDNNDSIQLQLDNDSDVTAYSEGSRAYSVDITRTSPSNGMLAEYTLKAGNLTFSRHTASPSASDLPPDTSAVTFLSAQVTVGDYITVEEMRVYVDAVLRTKADGTTAIDSSDCASGTTLRDILAAKFDNVKIWNGSRLAAGAMTSVEQISAGSFSGGACTINNAYYLFNDSFTLKTGLNILNVTADINRYASADETISFSFDTPSSWLVAEYDSNGDEIPSSEINGSASGSVFTIQAASITLTRHDGNSDGEDMVVGGTDTLLLTFKVQAGSASDVTISHMDIEDGADDIDGTYITGLAIYEHNSNTRVSDVQNLGSDDLAQFDGLELEIPSGGYKLYDVRGSISTAWDTSDDLQLYITNVSGRDSEHNDASITYPDCQISGCSPNNALAFAEFNLNGTAQVIFSFDVPNDSVYSNLSTPTGFCSDYNCSRRVAGFKVLPLYDDVTLKYLKLSNDDDGSNYASRFGTFYLVDESTGDTIDTGSMSDSAGVDGSITFNGFGYRFDKNDETDVGVYAEVYNIQNIDQSGSIIKLYLGGVTDQYVEFISANVGTEISSSSITNSAEQGSSSIQQYLFRKSKPVITYRNHSLNSREVGPLTSNFPIYKFSMRADGGVVEWKQMTFDVSTTAGLSASNFKLYIEGHSSALNSTGSSISSGEVVITPNSIQQLDNGDTINYELRADFLVTDDSSNQSLSVKMTAADDGTLATGNASSLVTSDFVWSDRSAQSHSSATNDWFNGYLVKSLDSDTITILYRR